MIKTTSITIFSKWLEQHTRILSENLGKRNHISTALNFRLRGIKTIVIVKCSTRFKVKMKAEIDVKLNVLAVSRVNNSKHNNRDCSITTNTIACHKWRYEEESRWARRRGFP